MQPISFFRTIPIENIIFPCWLFLFFFLSGADLLYFPLYIFKGKVSNLVALIGFLTISYLHRLFFVHKSLLLVAAVTFFSTLISAYHSPLISRSLGYSFAYLIEFFLYFSLSYHLIFFTDEQKVLTMYKYAFFAVGTYAFLQLFFSFFGIIDPLLDQFIGTLARPHAFMYEPSYYALYMGSYVFFYSCYLLFKEEKLVWKEALSSLILHFFFLLSTSTGAFFSYFFFIPVVLVSKWLIIPRATGRYFYRRLASGIGFITSCFCVAFLVIPSIFIRYFFKFFDLEFAKHISFSARWEGIERAVMSFLYSPLFGKGIGGIGPYFYYLYHKLEEQTKLSMKEIESYDPTNIITEILGSLGIVGFFAYSIFIPLIVIALKKISRLHAQHHERRTIGISLALSWILVMIMSQFNPGLFRNYLWIHTGIVFGYIHKTLIGLGYLDYQRASEVTEGSSRNRIANRWRRFLPSLS